MASVLFLLALLVGTLALAFCVSFAPFLQPIAFAIVIAIGFYPLYLGVVRMVRGPNKSAPLAMFIVPPDPPHRPCSIASAAGGELIKAARYFGDQHMLTQDSNQLNRTRHCRFDGAAVLRTAHRPGVLGYLGERRLRGRRRVRQRLRVPHQRRQYAGTKHDNMARRPSSMSRGSSPTLPPPSRATG